MQQRTMSHMWMMIAIAAASLGAQAPAQPGGQPGRAGGPATPPMELSTPAFKDGSVIPDRHTQLQQAERGGGVAVALEDLGDAGGLLRPRCVVARPPAGNLCDRAEAQGVVVPAGQQRGPGG